MMVHLDWTGDQVLRRSCRLKDETNRIRRNLVLEDRLKMKHASTELRGVAR